MDGTELEARLREVPLGVTGVDELAPALGAGRVDELRTLSEYVRDALSGRSVWSISSTASGGGVAELLTGLLPYSRGAGVDARWLVIQGDPEFFRITKRLHNGFHGFRGDGGELGDVERRHYDEVLADNAAHLRAHVRAGDVVVLHDPQTLGLAGELRRLGTAVVWRCHIPAAGGDEPGERSWRFLRPDIDHVDAVVFSRAEYAPEWMAEHPVQVAVIPPTIDPLSPKNQDLDGEVVRAILAHTGLVGAPGDEAVAPVFRRRDGSPQRVDRFADIIRTGPSPSFESPLVVQVSRWDTLKDMAGVMAAFSDHVLDAVPDGDDGPHLLLVGPNVSGVSDDPEGGDVLTSCVDQWRELPHATRRRIGLACVPMTDVAENAAIVNALQRHAAVVVQKSLAEGFGLTVAEAMWKGRPVVASRVGGLQDQIEDGVSGVLVSDPSDLATFGSAVSGLLNEPDRASRLGDAARTRVRDRFLHDTSLVEWAALVLSVVG